jgi:hypothetical protein
VGQFCGARDDLTRLRPEPQQAWATFAAAVGHGFCNPKRMATKGTATAPRTDKARASTPKVEGEGSYSATRRYNKNLRAAAADEVGIKRGAKQAREAVEGAEGAELRAAEQRAKAGPRPAAKRARSN